MSVYVDTGAWIALYEPRDRHHDEARGVLEQLLRAGESLVTGWHTVVEFVDGVAHRYGQARAAEALRRLVDSPRLRIEPTDEHRETAMEFLTGRSDWGVDLSDCLSFAFMEAEEIRTVFTFDGDFEKPGFQRTP